jgi:hypothetical protein
MASCPAAAGPACQPGGAARASGSRLRGTAVAGLPERLQAQSCGEVGYGEDSSSRTAHAPTRWCPPAPTFGWHLWLDRDRGDFGRGRRLPAHPCARNLGGGDAAGLLDRRGIRGALGRASGRGSAADMAARRKRVGHHLADGQRILRAAARACRCPRRRGIRAYRNSQMAAIPNTTAHPAPEWQRTGAARPSAYESPAEWAG